MELPRELQRYFERQSALYAYGLEGLEKLQEARVAIVGCGGVGSAVADYLARSGLGYLRLIDQDTVDPSNLHRMHLASKDDVYSPKAEAVSRNLAHEHRWLEVDPIVDTLRSNNVDGLLDTMDLVIDGLDNFRSRYVLNNFSLRTRTPYFFASAIGNQAHAILLTPPKTPCLQCVLPNVVQDQDQSCEMVGVTAPIVGMIGTVLASETVKHLVQGSSRLTGRLLTIDLAGPDFLISAISKRWDCTECTYPRVHVEKDGQQDDLFSILCGENTISAVPHNSVQLDLETIPERLPRTVQVLSASKQALVYSDDDQIISIFSNGRLLIRGTTEENARSLALKVWKILGIQTLIVPS